MGYVAVRLDKQFDVSLKETFHKFFRSFTNIISNNIYSEKDNTIKLLSPIIKNDKTVILAAYKESCITILNKSGKFKFNNIIRKFNNFIKEGIRLDKHIETIDITHSGLKHFQDFLQRYFTKSEHCDLIRAVSNQPGRLFATAKMHTFPLSNDIAVENLN